MFHSAVCNPINLFLWPGAGASLFWSSDWSSVVRACVSVKKIQIVCHWPTVHARSSLFADLGQHFTECQRSSAMLSRVF